MGCDTKCFFYDCRLEMKRSVECKLDGKTEKRSNEFISKFLMNRLYNNNLL